MEKLLGYTKRCTAHLEHIIYTIEPHERSPAYIAAAPCGMSVSITAKIHGKVKPQGGTATAFVGIAPAGHSIETTATVRKENEPNELE